MKKALALCASLLAVVPAVAQEAASPPASPPPAAQGTGWQGGAVLDVTAQSKALALGQRDKGLALGHSDLTAYGPLGEHIEAQLTAAVHSHDSKTELELEEAWFQTRTLPGGFQMRGGRFASQIGYLNEQHPHADDFVERPLLYRAFLGSHYFDDGLRINWVAPTDIYFRLGAEFFRGKNLVEEAVTDEGWPSVMVLNARLGGDIGTDHSWQVGLSYMRNEREASGAHERHDHGDDHDHAHGHTHAHGAAFSGRNMWLGDIAWKWAPDGNNARQQLRVVYELAVMTHMNQYARSGDRNFSDYLSVVWRFRPDWEIGLRTDALEVRMPHDEHFHDGELRETALTLAYKPTHQQTLRLQATHQRTGGGFDNAVTSVQLQYILSFGAHAAHSF